MESFIQKWRLNVDFTKVRNKINNERAAVTRRTIQHEKELNMI